MDPKFRKKVHESNHETDIFLLLFMNICYSSAGLDHIGSQRGGVRLGLSCPFCLLFDHIHNSQTTHQIVVIFSHEVGPVDSLVSPLKDDPEHDQDTRMILQNF